jgi:hypothetical protein
VSAFYEAVDKIQKTEVAKILKSRIEEINVTLELSSGDMEEQDINDLEKEKQYLSKIIKEIYWAF